MLRDIRVDDRDIPEFPNYGRFLMDKQGLGLKPYSRQLYIGLELMGEICHHCSNPKYQHVEDVPVALKADAFEEHFVLLNYGKCPKCKRNKLDLLRDKTVKPYQELGALLGQRSGKSVMLTAPISAYLTHRYLKLQRPYEMYDLNPTTLFGTFVAQTFANAYEQIWLPYKTYIDSSPWFQSMFDLLRDTGNRLGEELFKSNLQSLHFLHRQLMFYPAGPNRKLLRGKTRILGGIDEWDFFSGEDDQDAVRMNGQEVYVSLDNSMANVRVGWKEKVKQGFYNTPNAFFLATSSPESSRGVMTRHVRSNLHSRRIYAVNLATWEISPKLTRKALQSFFDRNAEAAERDFGANPPANASGFLSVRTTSKIKADIKNSVKYKYETKKTKRGEVRTWGTLLKSNPGSTVPPSVLALDAGFSFNSFSLVVAHPLPDRRFRLRAMIEIMPKLGMSVIDYSEMAKSLIYPVMKAFNVKAVVADRWNSLKLLHDVESDFPGVIGQQYSVKYRDFTMFKSYAEDGAVEAPPPSTDLDVLFNSEHNEYPLCFDLKPVDHFYLQCMTVRDDGKTVSKGMNLTDDLFRASVLASHFVCDADFCDEYLKDSMKKQGHGAIGALSSLSYGNRVHGGISNPQAARNVAVVAGGMVVANPHLGVST